MANEIRGWEPVLNVNGNTYYVKEGEPDESISTARSDDTSGGVFEAHVVDKRRFEFSLKALRKSNLNPHAAPLNIANVSTTSSTIQLWPGGAADIADDTKSWRATIVWQSYRESYNAESGLVTLNAKGVSTGSYKRPGES